MFNDFISQFGLINSTLNTVGSLGLIYLMVRGHKHLKGHGRAILILTVIIAFYFVSFVFTRGEDVSHRYYQPVLPFMLILSALGFYCLGRDIGKMKAFYIGFGVLIAIFIGYTTLDPVRAHRKPQTDAGRWLSQHDPDYRGPVASDYSQPICFTKMSYFPTFRNEWLFLKLADGENPPMPVKYIIVEDDSNKDCKWAGNYAESKGWRLIYPNERHPSNERGIRIFENPNYQ